MPRVEPAQETVPPSIDGDRLRGVPAVSFRQNSRAPRLVLWDEERGRMVTFRRAARQAAAEAVS